MLRTQVDPPLEGCGIVTVVVKERLQRVLGLPKRTFQPATVLKLALLGGVLLLIGLLAAFSDHSPNLSHMRVGVLSASARGNYYEIVNALAMEARQQKGHIDNITSAGSVENISRLVASQTECDVHFALVQDGMSWPVGHQLELIGRLSKAESLVFLGRDADRIKALTDLRGMRIGIGPLGGGTERVARQVLAPLTELDITLSTQSIDEQFVKLDRGELDLAAMVIDEDARLLAEAVRDRGLQIMSLPSAGAMARQLSFARVGRIGAGQYDPVRLLPGEAKDVLQIGTLIVGNRCARRSATQAFITVLAAVFPDFVRYNRDMPNRTGLRLAPAAHSYFDQEGPDLVGVYVPWVVDIMPTASWIQLVLGVSLLFNAMSLGHRFRLWRIDANRLRTERAIPLLFGPGITVGDIAAMSPGEKHCTPEARAQLDAIMDQLMTLAERSRRQSQSVLVPMGQEMGYRYQEALIADLLHALRTFRDRLRP
jgi:NMT1-like family